ncbi:histone lysine demethylase jmjd6b, partial [Cystoisospora suis]
GSSFSCACLVVCLSVGRHDNIPRVAASELSVEDFIERYEKPNKPVVLTGVVEKWPAFSKWTKSFFLQFHADRRCAAGAASDLPLKTFYSSCFSRKSFSSLTSPSSIASSVDATVNFEGRRRSLYGEFFFHTTQALKYIQALHDQTVALLTAMNCGSREKDHSKLLCTQISLCVWISYLLQHFSYSRNLSSTSRHSIKNFRSCTSSSSSSSSVRLINGEEEKQNSEIVPEEEEMDSRGSSTIRESREDEDDKIKGERQLRGKLLKKQEAEKKMTPPALSSYTREGSLPSRMSQRGEEGKYREKKKKDIQQEKEEEERGSRSRLLLEEKRRRRKEEEEEDSEKDGEEEEEVDHLRLPSIRLDLPMRPSAYERYGRRRRREEEEREGEGKKDIRRTVDMREEKFGEMEMREKAEKVYSLHDEDRHIKRQKIVMKAYNRSRCRTRRTNGGDEEEGVKYRELTRAVHTLQRAIETCAEKDLDEEERFHSLFGLD